LVAVLLVPAVWSAGTAFQAGSAGGLAAAGPATGGFGAAMSGMSLPAGTSLPAGMAAGAAGANGGAGAGSPFDNAELTDQQRRIVDYAKRHGDGAAITVAVNAPAMMTASYIIGTDETVIGMGGFMGSDNTPSTAQLSGWVAEGKLKFVLSSAGGAAAASPGGGFGGGMAGLMGPLTGQRQQWVEQHC